MYFKPILSTLLKPRHACALYNHIPKRSHWNKDYKPGKYPKTFEQRMAAAEKYNLDVEEYVPYPDGRYFGDYPKLPDFSDASKDSYYPYDYPEVKRNFNEPLHVDSDHFGEDRYDIDQFYTLRPPFWVQVAQFFGAMLVWGLTMTWFERCRMFPGLAPKQFPHQDKQHYTFESCTAEEHQETQEKQQ